MKKRIITLAAVICLMAGLILPVHGEEIQSGQKDATVEQGIKSVTTDIYHKHVGNSGEKGGCYQNVLPHQHEGNSRTGGSCYQTPVYHHHQGNGSTPSGCYTRPVYHRHQGNVSQGGNCYTPVFHSHSDTCYEVADCMVYYVIGEEVNSWYENCYRHGETLFTEVKAVANHESCGKGQMELTLDYCKSCGFHSPTIHSYSKAVCGMREDTVVGYGLSCGKTEDTIERYDVECGLAETEIEGYQLSCNQTIDGYTIGCGYDEGTPCGRLVITSELKGQGERSALSVRLEDFSGGKLQLCENPYEWSSHNGSILGTGESITVEENGTYMVTVTLENEDVDETGLKGSITVDNICKIMPSPTATKEPLPTASPTATKEPLPTASPEATKEPLPTASPEATKEPLPTASPTATKEPLPTASPTATKEPLPAISPKDTENSESEGEIPDTETVKIPEKNLNSEGHEKEQPEETEIPGTRLSVRTPDEENPQSSPTPTEKVIKKEIHTVSLPEKESAQEITYVVGEEKTPSFWEKPMAGLITLTVGTVLLIAAGILLLLYLKQCVWIFNDDGRGRMICLGHCMVRTGEEGYAITLSKAMVEKTCTNRYCIKPGVFLLGKKEGQELIIYKEGQRTAVYLSSRMIVML